MQAIKKNDGYEMQFGRRRRDGAVADWLVSRLAGHLDRARGARRECVTPVPSASAVSDPPSFSIRRAVIMCRRPNDPVHAHAADAPKK